MFKIASALLEEVTPIFVQSADAMDAVHLLPTILNAHFGFAVVREASKVKLEFAVEDNDARLQIKLDSVPLSR